MLEQFRGEKNSTEQFRTAICEKNNRNNCLDSIEQHRALASGIGQQMLMLEQFIGVKDSTEQLRTVLCEKKQQQ